MDKESIIREWFYRLAKGYAEPPYSKMELDTLHEILKENGLNGSIFVNENIDTGPKRNYKPYGDKYTEYEKATNPDLKEVDQLDQAFLDAKPVEDEETINIKEALIKIGGNTYQLNKAEIEKITGYLEKDMKKKNFSPMSRQVKTASGKSLVPKGKRTIGTFAEEEHWQNWLSSVEGVIPDKKLQKLYFTLYDITSATYTAKYIDEVLDELYSADAKSLARYLFSLKKAPIGEVGFKVPEDFQGLADIGTVRGGSKGTEMGRGEFLIPLLFDRGELGGANATHDVDINGQGWHVKELKNRNTYIRLGKNTFANSNLAKALTPAGVSKTEFALSAVYDKQEGVRPGIVEALNDAYGGVESDYDALIKIQEELDKEMRAEGVGFDGGQGVIFYVPVEQTAYFVPTEDCICGGGTQGAHVVGMSYSGRPEGKFAAQARKIG